MHATPAAFPTQASYLQDLLGQRLQYKISRARVEFQRSIIWHLRLVERRATDGTAESNGLR